MTLGQILVSVVVPLALGLLTLAGVVLLHRREREKLRTETAVKAEDRTQAAAQSTIQTALEERGLEQRVNTLDQRYDRLMNLLDEQAKASAAFRETVAKEYMTRDEFLQSQARIERKIDAIGEHILEIARGMRAT